MQEFACVQKLKFIVAFEYTKAIVFHKNSKKVKWYDVIFNVLTTSPSFCNFAKFKVDTTTAYDFSFSPIPVANLSPTHLKLVVKTPRPR